MTSAHRVTGNAPLGVLLRGINRDSYAWATTAVPGATLGQGRNRTAAGTGTLFWDDSEEELTYTAPGDSAGTPVDASADIQALKIYSANGVDYAYLDWDVSAASAGDETRSITITQTWDSGMIQPTDVLDPGDGDYATLGDYLWFSDDIYSPIWTNTNNHNSNTDWDSPISFHLFTQPGTYPVYWTRCVDGTRYDYTQTITVSRQEDTATVYYVDATTGSDSDDGLTPANALQTFSAGVSKFTGSNIMVKFKRGETFTANAAYTLNQQNSTISTYYNSDGSDDAAQAKPTINYTPTSGTLFSVGTGIDDAKICHLKCVGPNSGTARCFGPADSGRTTTNVLIYDCEAEKFHQGLTTGAYTPSQYHFYCGNYFHDIGYGSGGNGFYCHLFRSAAVGNRVDDTLGGEHCFRCPAHDEAYIADNKLDNPATGKNTLTLRGLKYAEFGIWYQENDFASVLRNRASLSFDAPTQQNGTSDERYAHTIVSGNILRGNTSASFFSRTRGNNGVCWKNNILDISGGACVSDDRLDTSLSPEPAHRYVYFLNNTFVSPLASGSASALRFQGVDGTTAKDPQEIFLRNNIIHKAGAATNLRLWEMNHSDISNLDTDYNLQSPGTGNFSNYTPDAGSTTGRTLAQTQSALSLETHSATGDADFTDYAGQDYSLAATSDAIGAGDDSILKWVRYDLEGNQRTTDLDAGALERSASPPSPPDAGGTPPIADADSNVTSGTVPFSVNFTSESTGADSWSWRVDGNQFATTEDASYEFTEPGTYSVVLFVSNEDGSDESDPITITANAAVDPGGVVASSLLRTQ
ncbi:MAG: PKD domain-containing protein [Pirellulales bacterium]